MSWTSRATQLKDEGKTYQQIADTLTAELQKEFTYGKVRGWLRRHYGKSKNESTPKCPESKRTVVFKNGAYEISDRIELKHGQDITPDNILKAYGLKAGMWEVVGFTNNFWQSQKKGGEIIDLYQSKITVKAIKNGVDYESATEYINQIKPLAYTPIQHTKGDEMAEINIADLHLGKLAWHGDTGKNYDHKIAKDNFRKIIEDLAHRLKDRKLDYILFVWSNDYFNSDTIDKTTTADTPQDTDVRWQKLFQVGVQMLIDAIETLRQIAPVKTIYTPSNHDTMAGFYASYALKIKFENFEDVQIDTDAYPRKYIDYGINLIGFTHGDKENSRGTKEKASRLASCMPNEAAQQWGKTKLHEIHAAHLHSEQMIEEINGVLVRRVSSPTYSDTYHIERGYIGAQQKAMMFIWNKELGNTEIINSFV